MLRVSLALVTTALALLAASLEPAARTPGAAAAPRPSGSPDASGAGSGSLRSVDAHDPARASTPVEASGPAGDVTPSDCPRCEDTPDLTQTSPELGLPGGGASHCGPVAAANALAWLSGRGFQALVPGGDVAATPRQLMAPRYMRTDSRRGTLPFDLLEGLARWVRDAGYHTETLTYAGVRDHSSRRSAGLVRPSMAYLSAGLERDGVVLLHVGWYRETRPLRLARHGGHWVTLVGVDLDAGTLALNDPAPYAQQGQTERARVVPMTHGRLLRSAGLGHLAARGFLELSTGFPRRHADERAIVDGAVVLRVR